MPAILITDAETPTSLVAFVRGHGALVFRSVTDFDSWRAERRRGNLHTEVAEVLSILGVKVASLPQHLHLVIEHIARQTVTPSLSSIILLYTSERTLYRGWARHFPITPARFLREVRMAHLAHLQRDGIPRKRAVFLAGMPPHRARGRKRRQVAESASHTLSCAP
jgi:hypothetical protein